MAQGIIFKALSGFYYVFDGQRQVACRARGKFRKEGVSPLVGDRVEMSLLPDGAGAIDAILPRKNCFIRPPVANIDQMVIIASAVIPVTDPFLIDRVTAIAGHYGCECIICVNKSDLVSGEKLFDTYRRAGYRTILTSAVTGEGLKELEECLKDKVSAFTGNSGVGKSSILNALEPELNIAVGEVSRKLGRGRHTTRHVELFRLRCGAVIADTPGFSSFDTERMDLILKDELQYVFPEFEPYICRCRFADCAHVKEKGCAVLQAVENGDIPKSRHESYVRLYEQAKQIKEWELRDTPVK